MRGTAGARGQDAEQRAGAREAAVERRARRLEVRRRRDAEPARTEHSEPFFLYSYSTSVVC